MLRLTAPRVHAANGYSYRKYELSGETLQRAHGVIAAALEGDEPLTRPELAGALGQAGIVADGLRLGYILMHAELEELVCSGPRRGNEHTYAPIREPGPRIAWSSAGERGPGRALAALLPQPSPGHDLRLQRVVGPHGRRCEDRTGTGG